MPIVGVSLVPAEGCPALSGMQLTRVHYGIASLCKGTLGLLKISCTEQDCQAAESTLVNELFSTVCDFRFKRIKIKSTC